MARSGPVRQMLGVSIVEIDRANVVGLGSKTKLRRGEHYLNMNIEQNGRKKPTKRLNSQLRNMMSLEGF